MFCGAVQAEPIASDIVGYQNLDVLNGGKSYVGATFARVTGGSTTLGDFGVNENFAPMSDTLTLLDEYGGEAGVYEYLSKEIADAYNDGTGFTFVPGWYDLDAFNNWDGESTLPSSNSVALYDGEAMMIQSGSDDAALVSSGAVEKQAVELECYANKKTFLCNASPKTVNFGQITVNEEFAPMSDTLTFLNQYGGEASVYEYLSQELADAYNDGTGFSFVPGWYDYYAFNDWDGESTLPCANANQISAGAGFMIQTASEGAAIVIPSAL
ncbi:MAG: hypothetical protein II924_03225 [Kiritimatiellae bacterium]|nr:hypothetical protein [Kiritimatiellia bacterium]